MSFHVLFLYFLSLYLGIDYIRRFLEICISQATSCCLNKEVTSILYLHFLDITIQTTYNIVGKESKIYFTAKYSLLS